mgnify:CR=1 FL=1
MTESITPAFETGYLGKNFIPINPERKPTALRIVVMYHMFHKQIKDEIIESVPIIVVKKDKSRQVFDRQKLFNGMIKACEKRPVTSETIERAVSDIETQLQNSLDREVTSIQIGELAMEKLKDIDDVAYVRFASVYRQFRHINTFMQELNKLLDTDK